MTLTPADVAKLARLSRIELTDDECESLAPELGIILEAVRKVNEVVSPEIPMMTHARPLTNVMRPDEIRPSLSLDAALDQAPSTEDGQFRVPQILSED